MYSTHANRIADAPELRSMNTQSLSYARMHVKKYQTRGADIAPPIQALADARFAEVVAALGDKAVRDGLEANRTHEKIVQRAKLSWKSGGQT